MSDSSVTKSLVRVVGVKGAVLMGLGSIIGTGVFVSLGIAAGAAGPSMIFSLTLAGCLAVCNGLSSAQLAAAHPKSGGTYEYGYQFVRPWAGFTAGWMFMCAKSASAATAALGFAGYALGLFGASESVNLVVLASIVLGAIMLVTLSGIRRSNLANTLIVSITLFTLIAFVISGLADFKVSNFSPFFWSSEGRPFAPSFLEASALLFVAFTGYGRVATLGEEIKSPEKNIPKAVVATLIVSFLLYLIVAISAIGSSGAKAFYFGAVNGSAPLEAISSSPWLSKTLGIGAMCAMGGVLLNLILGLSRVAFAMAKRGDLPKFFSKIDGNHSPQAAILLSCGIIFILVLAGNVETTWSFSAFTVLIYYAITNLAALRLPSDKRLYPRFISWAGLFGCLGLSFWVNAKALIAGLGVLFIGFIWRSVFRRFNKA